jgi:hypothetical protein
MAESKSSDEKKAKPAAAKAAKPAAKSATTAKPAEGASAAAGKPKTKAEKTARSKATPPVSDGPACRAEKCRQPVRAKGYCRKHYIAWRRGETGEHHRYKICSKEGCRKPRAKGGLCDEHAGTAAPAAGAEGAAPA